MTMFAPSWAALKAIAFPIPRLAPVMNSVQPASLLQKKLSVGTILSFEHSLVHSKSELSSTYPAIVFCLNFLDNAHFLVGLAYEPHPPRRYGLRMRISASTGGRIRMRLLQFSTSSTFCRVSLVVHSYCDGEFCSANPCVIYHNKYK